MKNLVIQYYIDTNFYTQPNFNNIGPSPIEQYSSYSFQLYCKKHNIDYMKITMPKIKFRHPTWERFDLWEDRSWWDRYDQIMYVDSDVIAMPHSPNIFYGLRPDESFKSPVYRKYRSVSPEQAKILAEKNLLSHEIDAIEIRNKFIQPGVFILSKLCTEKMLPLVSEFKHTAYNIDDGMFLNYCLVKSGVPLMDLDYRYNYKATRKFNKRFNILKQIYFLHCAGGKKHEKGAAIWPVLQSLYPTINVNLLDLR